MKPTVVHILPYSGIGGTEIATLRLAQAARTSGIESLMLCPVQSVKEFFDSEGFRSFLYEQVEPSIRHPADYWRNSRQVARLLQREGVSLIHSSDVAGAYFTSLAALLAQKPLVCHVRNRADAISRRDRLYLKPVWRFIFVSQHTWRAFAVPVAETRGMVLYDGIDPQPDLGKDERVRNTARIRAELQIPEGRKIVGMVARIAPQKDFATLALAAALVLKKHDVCFAIVGDCLDASHQRLLEDTQKLLASLGIAERFVFTGFRRDVLNVVSAMDIFVLSTHREGFPLVILEALADARPVAATAVDGVLEIVSHERTGLLHGHKDHAQLAANLNRMLENPSFAAELGSAGQALVAAKFSRASYTADVARLYRTLLT